MHTNGCVLIEISMEIEMLNFLLGLLVTALMKETYFSISTKRPMGLGPEYFHVSTAHWAYLTGENPTNSTEM